ncbi:MAG: signal recognition particle-docking protein FtsY [Alphaproteobacteria bacterium]
MSGPAATRPGGGESAPRGWFARLRAGLGRSSAKLSQGITDLLSRRRLDEAALGELEDLLITADLGPKAAARLIEGLSRHSFGREVTEIAVREELARGAAEILAPVARELAIDRSLKPHVILVVGVNGTGKTTTIGKLARTFRDRGLTVMLAACDTFRAAAIEQLKIWGERTGSPVVAGQPGQDAAALAFEALERAESEGADVLLIDTAGRLQNKDHLMAELAKIIRVLKKRDAGAPHDVILVLDATTGQNAHSQVEVFKDMADVTGLVVTKLDGSARGGVLVALAERFAIPVYAVGVGEGAEDLRAFDAHEFARALLGL